MSNYMAMLVQNSNISDKDLLSIFVKDQKEIGKIYFDEPIDDLEVAIGKINNWTFLWSNIKLILKMDLDELSDKLTTLSIQNGHIFLWFYESVSGGLHFEFHENGLLLRKWTEVGNEVVQNIGEKIQQESSDIFNSECDEEGTRDEWKVVELMEAISDLSWDDDLLKMQCIHYKIK